MAISATSAKSTANTGSVVIQPLSNKEASTKTSALKVASYTTGAIVIGAGLVYAGYKVPQMLAHGKSHESMTSSGKNTHPS